MPERPDSYGRGPAGWQRDGAPGPIVSPEVIVVRLGEAQDVPQALPIGTVAIELSQASTCGPIDLDGRRLWPGDVMIVGDTVGRGSEQLRPSAMLVRATIKGDVPDGDYGHLAPVAILICHRDLRTVPGGHARSPRVEQVSIRNHTILAEDETVIVQTVCQGYRWATILAWAATGETAYTANMEWWWSPFFLDVGGTNYERTEIGPPVAVPVGDTVGVVVYEGSTRGAHALRLTGIALAGTTHGGGVIILEKEI